MDLDTRIEYWRGRARVAKRAGLQDEERACLEVVRLMVALRREQGRMEAKVGALVDQMPTELTTGPED